MNFVPVLYAVAVLGALGIGFGLVLSFADKKFAVETDEKVQQIRECLAGANCGACGFPGCDGFAQAVAEGRAPVDGCKPAGNSCTQKIAEIMGTTVAEFVPQAARVLCQGATDIAKMRYIYDGYPSCHAAAQLAGGPKQCQYACIGLGDCVNACEFNAITIKNTIAEVDENKCTACGMCESICPRNVIRLLPRTSTVSVRCRNLAPAREAKDSCSNACIGCKRCVKECKYDAIEVINGVAVIDPDKCTHCGDCAKVCPCNCIVIVA